MNTHAFLQLRVSYAKETSKLRKEKQIRLKESKITSNSSSTGKVTLDKPSKWPAWLSDFEAKCYAVGIWEYVTGDRPWPIWPRLPMTVDDYLQYLMPRDQNEGQ